MAKIKIKKIGPIKSGCAENEGFVEISKFVVFIGNQGSGKSTIAKLISTFMWMEKALVRGNYTKYDFTAVNFLETRLPYHRIKNYLCDDTEIEYRGEAYSISFKSGKLDIQKTDGNNYQLPQIIYTPADRNIIASVDNTLKLKNISGLLSDFLIEYGNAITNMVESIELPIINAKAEYDKAKHILYIVGADYRIKLSEAASGFQSVVPLYLVSRNLCNSVKNLINSESMSGDEKIRFAEQIAHISSIQNLKEEQKRIAISELGKKFNKTVFVNIIEEPEQNLFPASQWLLLQKLLELNNAIPANKTRITTHSPYLINYLTLTVEANIAKNFCKTEKQKNDLFKIVPENSMVNPQNLNIYELNENDGTINLLEPYEGLPSDENKLNYYLGETNTLFSDILELE
jgi:predicted ATPase